MNNRELCDAIASTFQACIDSYKFGATYGDTTFHKAMLNQLRKLLAEQLGRAKS